MKLKHLHISAMFVFLAVGLAACGDDTTKTDGIDRSNTGVINVAPGSIEFASTEIGSEDIVSVLVTNTGTGNLRVSSLKLEENTADGNREFVPGDGWASSFTLAPNASREFKLKWMPVDSVTDSGKLIFVSNDPTNGTFEVPINTPRLAPQIISPQVVQFPRVAAGTKQSQLTFIQNGGQAPLQIKDVFVELRDKGFTVSFPDPATPSDPEKDTDTWKATLQPNEQIPVRVTFAPTDDNPSTDTLVIKSNDPDEDTFTVSLKGNAGTPCILLTGVSEVMTPATDETHELNFGLRQIGNASNKTVQIQNCSRTEKLTVSDIMMVDDGGGVFAIKEDTLPEGLDMGAAVIDPLDSAAFTVSYTPAGEDRNSGRLIVKSDDPVNSELRVNTLGVGSLNECPVARATGSIDGGRPAAAINTIPLKTVQLSGTQSSDPDGQVDRYEWSLIKQPVNSTTRLSPSNAISEPKLFLDLAGEYIVELTVYDKLGTPSCETSRVTILSQPNEDIHIQLVWNNNNTDVDLHYLHPRGRWDQSPYDIFWRNPTADWGVPGRADDDPSLDIDDTDGFGPENINHDNPVSGESYRVGVHYFADNGNGATYITIRIYLEGTLKFELREQYMEKEGKFLDVGFISWPSKEFGLLMREYNGFP